MIIKFAEIKNGRVKQANKMKQLEETIEIQLQDDNEKYNKIIAECEKSKREAKMMTAQGISNCNLPPMDEHEKEDTRKFLDKLFKGELER